MNNNKEEVKEGFNSALKVGLVVLIVVVLGLGILTGTIYKQKKDVTKILENEKKLLVEDLNNLKLSYEAVIVSRDSVSLDLNNARQSIMYYIDSLKSARIDLSSLKSLKRQLLALKEERGRLLRINDSLLRSNRLLTTERDSIAKLFMSQKTIADSLIAKSLEAQAAKAEDKLEDVSELLTVTSVTADGVIQKSSGKIKVTPKAKKADKIRVCYVVSKKTKKTNVAPIKFYVVITDEKGEVLGEKKSVTNESTGEHLVYSIISNFQYGKSAKLNVCDYVGPVGGKNFVHGKYKATLYDSNLKVVGNTANVDLE